MSTILTVRELTDTLTAHMEGRFPFVWVKGEVSNISRPASGHVYFSLKDSEALLNCVWFRGNQRSQETFDPLTGEVFEGGPRPSLAQTMVHGQQLLCAGKVTLYAQRSTCQMVVELVQEEGRGALHAAFEALKERLQARGFFATERKRPLPYSPCKVAVVTAATGAAVQDFIRIANERGTHSHIRIIPVPVQGEAAAPAIVRALCDVGIQAWADVVVLIRGGGSLEDLWTFNEESVAEAVFLSPTPVLAGIGHEVDVCMADMTADVRAATPSHAAQILWPARQEHVQYVDGLELALRDAVRLLVDGGEKLLRMQERALQWLSPVRALCRREENLARCTERLLDCGQRRHTQEEKRLYALEKALHTAMFALVQKYTYVVRHRQQALQWLSPVRVLEEKQKNICDHTARLERVTQAWYAQKKGHVAALVYRLDTAMTRYLGKYTRTLENFDLRLMACSPLAPLERGYALVQTDTGQVLTSARQAHEGQCVRMSFADGTVSAVVENISS